MVLVLRKPEGLQTIPLKPGASGFAEASLGSVLYKSEIPNLMLQPPAVKVPVKKRPAAAAASAAGASKRKKAAAPARQQEEEEEEEEAEEPEAGEEAGSDFGGGQDEGEAGEGDEEELGKAPGTPVAEEGKPSQAADRGEPAPEATKPRAYHKMWYCPPRSAWAIRQVAAPKRQIFQISCSSVQLDQAGLEVLFDEALAALATGAVKEHSCKEWILHKARSAHRP
jgi:hypothetical protein